MNPALLCLYPYTLGYFNFVIVLFLHKELPL